MTSWLCNDLILISLGYIKHAARPSLMSVVFSHCIKATFCQDSRLPTSIHHQGSSWHNFLSFLAPKHFSQCKQLSTPTTISICYENNLIIIFLGADPWTSRGMNTTRMGQWESGTGRGSKTAAAQAARSQRTMCRRRPTDTSEVVEWRSSCRWLCFRPWCGVNFELAVAPMLEDAVVRKIFMRRIKMHRWSSSAS